MSDFSDRPFVAGSLTGLRAFDVDKYGRLCGPTYREVFKPGENVASCGGRSGGTHSWMLPPGMTFTYYPTLGDDPTVPPPRKPKAEKPREKPKHQVGGVGCSCGYYAYFDGENDYARSNRASAIIEGYGVCTVGDRGFRAEKARLVALVDNRPLRKSWWMLPFCGLLAALEWVWFGFIVEPEPTGSAVLALIAAVVMTAVALAAGITNGWRFHRTSSPLDKVRKNYPDVPVYRTQRAALRAHPVSIPEGLIPTPDDEDFWARPVTS